MNQYPKKYSNNKWIGYIPKGWKIVNFKQAFKIIYRYPTYYDIEYVEEGISEIRGEALQENGLIMKLEDERYISEETNNLFPSTRLKEGDLVISVRGTMGKVGYVDRRYEGANITANLLRLSPWRHLTHGYYLRYYFLSHLFNQYLEAYSPQTTIKTITMPQLTKIPIVLPPLDLQDETAKYLDKQCAAIDKVIEIKKEQLTILDELRKSTIHKAVTKGLDDNVELVDSGVEWIGKVPNGWKVKRIKRFAKVKRGASPRPIEDQIYFDDDGEYAWVRIQDVTASERYLENTRQRLSELGSSLSVKQFPGDLFISIAGTVGKPVITKIKCCIHDGFIWFENPIFNKEYLYYIFISEGPYQGLGKLGTQLNLNTDTVGQIFIPAPSLDVQGEIVASLDDKCREIKELANNIENQITVLESYRKSLIHECVTGKRRIIKDDLKELANVSGS
jgi:type I restriction enzyme S subunit